MPDLSRKFAEEIHAKAKGQTPIAYYSSVAYVCRFPFPAGDGVMVKVNLPRRSDGFFEIATEGMGALCIYGWEGKWLGDAAAPGSFRPGDPDRAQRSGVVSASLIMCRGGLVCKTVYRYGTSDGGESQWSIPNRIPGASLSF